jgi:hypothetical protein
MGLSSAGLRETKPPHFNRSKPPSSDGIQIVFPVAREGKSGVRDM